MKHVFSGKIFGEVSSIKCNQNSSSGSRVVTGAQAGKQTDGRTDGRGDMTKALVGFRTFANASKNAILTCLAINGYIAVSILLYVHGCNRKF
jgi:hypothetical protein